MNELVSMSDLLDLQAVDSQIDKLMAEREGMPELAEHATAVKSAKEAQQVYEQAAQHLQELDRRIDRLEDELQSGEQTLTEKERRLFAGGFSARETENMRIEVEGLRRQNSVTESELLELLDQRETAVAKADEGEQAVSSAQEVVDGLASTIAGKQSQIDSRLAVHKARRAEVVPLIAQELLSLYQELRERRGAVVVVGALSGRTCGACHIEMSLAEYEEVVLDSPPRCIHCGAIVVP